MLSPSQIETMIHEALPDADVTVREYSGGGDHFQVVVASEAFAGKTRVAQHQMVYGALKGHLDDGVIHALALQTSVKE